MTPKYFLFLIAIFYSFQTFSQKSLKTDASNIKLNIISGHLKMGNPGPHEKEIILNNKYMTIGGEAVVPVMGEIHYSRLPVEEWEDVVLKMKANGINIIAFYVIWIHHEQIEGQFDWIGNRNLRAFVKLCQKHDLLAYPRIGPWCHGEVRNGGTPDWILEKTYIQDRSNHPVYQHYAKRWYEQIASQLEGLLDKDSGPVIGVQLENEYRRGPGGVDHIAWLKETAKEVGLDVPMYTITGWGNISLPKDEVIPLFGGYPATPWATHNKVIEENESFSFEAPINDEQIGNEGNDAKASGGPDFSRYPYFTCEIGVGNQLSEHRRPIISPIDGLAITVTKLGSGSNLPGYYVFAGGINPTGIYNTMEENQEETGYWNEYPDISYDFQAAIGETGELAPSYHQLKKLHYFLNEFGDRLAPMSPIVPKGTDARKELQYAVRSDGKSAFVFGMNYYRGTVKPVQKNIRFEIKFQNETITFPSSPVDIPDSSIFIWPVNFSMGNILLKYATVQPLCKLDQDNRTDWFFIQNGEVNPEMAFDGSTLMEAGPENPKPNSKNGVITFTNLQAGIGHPVKLKDNDGHKHFVYILTPTDASHFWLLKNKSQKYALLSNSNLYLNNNQLHMYGPKSEITITDLSNQLTEKSSGITNKINKTGYFNEYVISLPENSLPDLKIQEKNIIDEAKWLNCSSKENSNQLFHKVFIKEFNLGNPSEIKRATLYLYADTEGKIKINDKWLNQSVHAQKLNLMDLTGYMRKGANTCLLDFPVRQGTTLCAARLEVEYFNADIIEITTDRSWLTTEKYIVPVPGSKIDDLKEPEISAPKEIDHTDSNLPYQEWTISIPENYPGGIQKWHLHLMYNGDKGQCYFGHRLISDSFNNGTPWRIAPGRLPNNGEGKNLTIRLYPLPKGHPFYIEKPLKTDTTEITGLVLVPEYSLDLIME